MSDARSLLRAKRQESSSLSGTRITHPYASYTSQGQLRCTACGVSIKTQTGAGAGAAVWEGHLGSKAHRVAVRNLKAREEEERAREVKRAGKRKAGEDVDEGRENGMEVDGMDMNAKKRRTSVEPQLGNDEKSVPSTKPSALPVDFFSNPTRAPILSTADEDDGDEDQTAQPPPAPPSSTLANQPKSQIDLEWEQFQASLAAPPAGEADKEEEEDDRRAAFERATVAAEPELVATNAAGFPPEVVADGPGGVNGAEEEKKEVETEEERRRRKEQEERELIMDRLIEEERVQEEADERVGLLKARVEALKRAREARRMEKAK